MTSSPHQSQEDLSAKSRKLVEEKRKNIYKSMSAEQKLTIAAELYYAALGLKKAHLKRLNPDWTQTQIDNKAREWMLYART